jgi:hypothetical protein
MSGPTTSHLFVRPNSIIPYLHYWHAPQMPTYEQLLDHTISRSCSCGGIHFPLNRHIRPEAMMEHCCMRVHPNAELFQGIRKLSRSCQGKSINQSINCKQQSGFHCSMHTSMCNSLCAQMQSRRSCSTHTLIEKKLQHTYFDREEASARILACDATVWMVHAMEKKLQELHLEGN